MATEHATTAESKATRTKPAKRPAGLVAAADDSKLLRFELWPRQRELLAAVENGPRLHVWALGRRSGKTTLAALVALWDCLLRPELDQLVRPGERRYAVAVATNLRQARLFVQAARSIVEQSPILARLVEQATEDEIVFRNGTALAAFPCSSRGGRGWPISCLLMDEAAHFLDETGGPQAADRVWSALVPSTAQFGDKARIIVASTPYGTSGLFAKLHKQAEAGELEDAQAAHATTAQVNPTVDARFLEREQARDPDSFRAEYLAEFLTAGAAFLPWDAIQEAVDDSRLELSPSSCTRPVAAIDPAFASDPFALAIVSRDSDRLRLALARSWRPTKGNRLGTAVLDEVAAILERYGISEVATDQASAELVADYLATRGIRVEKRSMTADSKTHAYSNLKARLLDGTLELYRHPELLAELGRIEARYTAGRSSISIPRVGGSHGDIAQALALAVSEGAQPRSFAGISGVLEQHHGGWVSAEDMDPVEHRPIDDPPRVPDEPAKPVRPERRLPPGIDLSRDAEKLRAKHATAGECWYDTDGTCLVSPDSTICSACMMKSSRREERWATLVRRSREAA